MRRTARRRPSRRSRKQDEHVALLVAAIAAASLVAVVVQWLLTHWWVLLAAVAAAVASGLWLQKARQRAEWERVRARALRMRIAELDALDHRAFEFAIRDLMRRDGCEASSWAVLATTPATCVPSILPAVSGSSSANTGGTGTAGPLSGRPPGDVEPGPDRDANGIEVRRRRVHAVRRQDLVFEAEVDRRLLGLRDRDRQHRQLDDVGGSLALLTSKASRNASS